jgi:hypothetical protein
MKKLQNDEFISRLDSSIELISEFNGLAHKVKVRCRICGNEWSVLAGNLVNPARSTGCPICAKMPRKTTEQFAEELGPDFKVLGQYTNSKAPIRVKHRCGYEWDAIPNNLLRRNGSGCPRCENNLNLGVTAMRNAKGPEYVETHNKSALRYRQYTKEVSK